MESQKSNRRKFIHNALLGAGLGMIMPAMAAASTNRSSLPSAAQRVIVFQGDSITDGGRERRFQAANTPGSMGSGYVGLITGELLGKNPGSGWKCYNRGISGNKVFELAARWEVDCLDLRPDVLSLLIGVNDFWHTLTHEYQGTPEVYEADLRTLLDRTKEALPEVKLIIGEPFAVVGGTAVSSKWFPAFPKYREAAASVAEAYQAVWIPYQQLFDEALEEAPPSFWCPDGVHPSPAGNYLMAQAWLDALRAAYQLR